MAKAPAALVKAEPFVRRLPPRNANATVNAEGPCTTCKAVTKNRIRINVLIGTVSVRLCRQCKKKLQRSAHLFHEFVKEMSHE